MFWQLKEFWWRCRRPIWQDTLLSERYLSFIMAQHMGPCIEQHVYDAFDVEKVNPCISDASVARSCTCAVVLRYRNQKRCCHACQMLISNIWEFSVGRVLRGGKNSDRNLNHFSHGNCRASLRIHFSAYNFFQLHRWLMLLNSQRM